MLDFISINILRITQSPEYAVSNIIQENVSYVLSQVGSCANKYQLFQKLTARNLQSIAIRQVGTKLVRVFSASGSESIEIVCQNSNNKIYFGKNTECKEDEEFVNKMHEPDNKISTNPKNYLLHSAFDVPKELSPTELTKGFNTILELEKKDKTITEQENTQQYVQDDTKAKKVQGTERNICLVDNTGDKIYVGEDSIINKSTVVNIDENASVLGKIYIAKSAVHDIKTVESVAQESCTDINIIYINKTDESNVEESAITKNTVDNANAKVVLVNSEEQENAIAETEVEVLNTEGVESVITKTKVELVCTEGQISAIAETVMVTGKVNIAETDVDMVNTEPKESCIAKTEVVNTETNASAIDETKIKVENSEKNECAEVEVFSTEIKECTNTATKVKVRDTDATECAITETEVEVFNTKVVNTEINESAIAEPELKVENTETDECASTEPEVEVFNTEIKECTISETEVKVVNTERNESAIAENKLKMENKETNECASTEPEMKVFNTEIKECPTTETEVEVFNTKATECASTESEVEVTDNKTKESALVLNSVNNITAKESVLQVEMDMFGFFHFLRSSSLNNPFRSVFYNRLKILVSFVLQKIVY